MIYSLTNDRVGGLFLKVEHPTTDGKTGVFELCFHRGLGLLLACSSVTFEGGNEPKTYTNLQAFTGFTLDINLRRDELTVYSNKSSGATFNPPLFVLDTESQQMPMGQHNRLFPLTFSHEGETHNFPACPNDPILWKAIGRFAEVVNGEVTFDWGNYGTLWRVDRTIYPIESLALKLTDKYKHR